MSQYLVAVLPAVAAGAWIEGSTGHESMAGVKNGDYCGAQRGKVTCVQTVDEASRIPQ
jgi:hypothetical protein